MVWARTPSNGDTSARLPLKCGNRPYETEYIHSLNEFYYSLLQAATWTTYDSQVPFIGAALLASAKGDPGKAIELAMECREHGALRKMFKKIDEAIRTSNRPKVRNVVE